MRRLDAKTVGLNFLLHEEIKRFCKEHELEMKDFVMSALTEFLIEKNKRNYDRTN